MQIEDVFGDFPTLETERVILRKLTMDDAEDMYEYASDSEVAKYTTWEAHNSIEDSVGFLNFLIQKYNNKQLAPWGIMLKSNQKVIGTCGYMNWIPQINRAELAYALSREFWGKGIMTEAANEILEFGFDKMKLNRIEAFCLSENAGSKALMRKIGMKHEGTLLEYIYLKGAYRDVDIRALLRRDYVKL
ncbi:GNAT family N-acetyltransferase [Paenibacillus wynnii]|uniref:GCN5 family acetyltransferase n=1 Tax=Paenibacillus wynnii TaxID=268407 RepID=A0A098MB53_9BACL|nr:GNAT family protein [Paenibacillus wynnii]KGE19774.1 GCN5 family acetyltransferase [Paenibacillus wynnii]